MESDFERLYAQARALHMQGQAATIAVQGQHPAQLSVPNPPNPPNFQSNISSRQGNSTEHHTQPSSVTVVAPRWVGTAPHSVVSIWLLAFAPYPGAARFTRFEEQAEDCHTWHQGFGGTEGLELEERALVLNLNRFEFLPEPWQNFFIHALMALPGEEERWEFVSKLLAMWATEFRNQLIEGYARNRNASGGTIGRYIRSLDPSRARFWNTLYPQQLMTDAVMPIWDPIQRSLDLGSDDLRGTATVSSLAYRVGSLVERMQREINGPLGPTEPAEAADGWMNASRG